MRTGRLFAIGVAAGLVAVVATFALRRARTPAFPAGLIQASGRIEGDEVTLASKWPGRVRALVAREGDAVVRGQTVAELDDAQARARLAEAQQGAAALGAELRAARRTLATLELDVPLSVQAAEAGVARAKSGVDKAEASRAQAVRDAERYRALAERGSLGRQRSEQAAMSADVAAGELETARANLVRAERQLAQSRLGDRRVAAERDRVAALDARLAQANAAVAGAASVLADLTIVAPSAGVVTTRFVEAGEVVPAGAPLLTVVDLDRLYLKVYVAEREIGRLHLGLPARVYTDAFPNRPFAATVNYIASRAEFTPKEVQTPDERVKLVYAAKLYLDENPDHRLTPGLPADAVIRWEKDAPWRPPAR